MIFFAFEVVNAIIYIRIISRKKYSMGYFRRDKKYINLSERFQSKLTSVWCY